GHGGDGQVGAGGQLPGGGDWLGGGPEEPAGQFRLAAGQAVAQRGGLQRGDRHALPVDRVEAADRVPDGQQSGGEVAQPFVAPPQVGREPVGADVTERFRVADRGEDERWGDG